MCKQESEKYKKMAEECPECKVTISDDQLKAEIFKILCPQGAGDWAYATSKKRIEELMQLFKTWR